MGGDRRRQLAALAEPQQLRSLCLAALTRAVDGCMRSPVFLTCMRFGLAAAIETQFVQANGRFRWLERRGSPRG